MPKKRLGGNARWQAVHQHRDSVASSGGANRASRRASLGKPDQIRKDARLARRVHDDCPRCELFAYANCPCCEKDHAGVAR